jgi:hypothetical protein
MDKRLLLVAFICAVLSAGLLSGCVERALVITSEPSGATVTVNQQWKGTTPYVVPFKHYGVYDIWIEHPGIEENGRMIQYYPLHVGEPVKAPAYQLAGLDFVSEVLLPTTLRDQQTLHYTLERVSQADNLEDMLARAQQLRQAGAARRQMRFDQDVERGRYDAEGNRIDREGRVIIPDDEMVDFDAMPPNPNEMPLFIDPE